MEKGRFQLMVQMLADIHSVNKAAEGFMNLPFITKMFGFVWTTLQVGDGEEKIHIDRKTELYVLLVQYV